MDSIDYKTNKNTQEINYLKNTVNTIIGKIDILKGNDLKIELKYQGLEEELNKELQFHKNLIKKIKNISDKELR